jgi:hypothetical protein
VTVSRLAKSILLLGCATVLIASVLRGSEGAAATPQTVRQQPGGSGWSANATAFRGQNGARFDFSCPSYGTAGPLYGTDVYTDDSSVCTAAVHTGGITLAGGGSVTIEIRPGQSSYKGSTRNGITSDSWGSWSGSFVVVDAKPSNPGVGSGGTGWELNATRFRTFLGARFAYGCPANGKPGPVWGTDVYTDDSSVCTAAVHAGRITIAKGGTVTIEMRPGQSSYTGSKRNGITSAPWNSWGGSFVFVGTQGPAPPPTGTATGTVLVNGQAFTGGTIPYGSKLDVTSGTLTMSTSLGTVAIYGDGTLPAQAVLTRTSEKISKGKQPLVQLQLTGGDFSGCTSRTTAGRASGSSGQKPKPKPVRSLWGKGKGRFRTKGRFSSATVRGTEWLTTDRCDGTLTTVKTGVVTVRDFTRNKTVKVKAGQSYLAPSHR